MKMFASSLMLLCLLTCASCTTVAERVVVKPTVLKAKVPAALIAPCPKPDRRKWKTTRDIVNTANANGAALATCAAQVDGVRKWNDGQ